MRIAPGPRQDGRTSGAVAAPPRKPGNALGPLVDDTSRNIPRASFTTSSFEASARPGVTPGM